MINKLTIFLFFIGVFGNLSAQEIGRLRSSFYSSKQLDESELQVIYDVTFVKNPKYLDYKTSSLALLSIGNIFSKFSDINQVKRDSLSQVYSDMGFVGGKELRELTKYPIIWDRVVLLDREEQKVRVQKRMFDNYEYEEVLPKFSWKLEEDTIRILNYQCKKATTTFAGRNYTAWYTTSIPISLGPYLFHGLPGLILRIADSENHYVFEAVGISKKKEPIKWTIGNNWKKITVKEFASIERSIHENPGFYVKGKAMDENGNPIVPKFPPKPYNPIERD